jgi:hemolysin-activating ACP:hemolysin acyltransferase
MFNTYRLQMLKDSLGFPRDNFAAKRSDAGDNRLTAVEWKSGTHMRIVDIVAPFGGEAEMRGQVGSTTSV